MTPCIWLGTTHPCNPPNYGLWVNLHFFMCIYKHCFLPMLLVFAMKCCTKKCLALCLITIIAACFLHLYACLTCSSVHTSSLHPLLAHHHLCYVDVYCVFLFFYFFYFLFLLYATFLCDSILAYCVCVHISLSFLFFVILQFFKIGLPMCLISYPVSWTYKKNNTEFCVHTLLLII